MSMSLLDSAQCIKTSFDDATGTLKVSQVGEFNVDIRATDGDTIIAVGTTDGTTTGTQKAIKLASDGTTIVRPVGYSSSHIATNTTTVSKSGAGLLHSVTINTKGASSNTITIYDNTAGSGTVLAVIDSTVSLVTLYYDVAFATGLTVVTATGTAPDITVAYL